MLAVWYIRYSLSRSPNLATVLGLGRLKPTFEGASCLTSPFFRWRSLLDPLFLLCAHPLSRVSDFMPIKSQLVHLVRFQVGISAHPMSLHLIEQVETSLPTALTFFDGYSAVAV